MSDQQGTAYAGVTGFSPSVRNGAGLIGGRP